MKNDDFLKKYEQFVRLIDYYTFKIGDINFRWDCWGFLYELEVKAIQKNQNLSNNYIAVAIRNFYLAEAKKRQKNRSLIAFIDNQVGVSIDKDISIDLKQAISSLPSAESKIIFEHFYCGKSLEKIAQEMKTTRQNEHKKKKRALTRLRMLLTNFF
jgi:RNA polymerase sigma factor (sigma-70 family)